MSSLYPFHFEDHWTHPVRTTGDSDMLFFEPGHVTTKREYSHVRVEGNPGSGTGEFFWHDTTSTGKLLAVFKNFTRS